MINADYATFLSSSTHLIEAHPQTTRILTKYRLRHGRGGLIVKTYDPVSGVVIRFKTSKGSEVGRVFAALHRLARRMLDIDEDVQMADAAGPAGGSAASTTVPAADAPAPAPAPSPSPSSPSPPTAPAGKIKRKKGKG